MPLPALPAPARWLVPLAAAVLLSGGLGAAVPARAATVPDTMAERTRACTACHGKEGRATSQGYFPRIAGKPAGYLYNQLINFREGRRANVAMSALIENLSDDYLREIADYYAALDLPYPPPQTTGTPRAVIERGAELVQRGDPARGLPACTRCHGAAMTGVAPAVPGLLGLPRDYLLGQFGAWANGQRHAATPDCMAQITQRLSGSDVSAMAAWLSSQPVPSNAHAATPTGEALPLRCGSVGR